MHCPDCNMTMNRHAEKPIMSLRSDDPAGFDNPPDAFVASIHCCAGCGKVEIETATGINRSSPGM